MGAAIEQQETQKGTVFSLALPNQEKPVRLTPDQYLAIRVLSNLAATTAQNAADTPVVVEKGKMTQEEAIAQAVQELPKAGDEAIAQRVRELLSK